MVIQNFKGSCHCGAIHFSFESEPITKGIRCNCSFCARRGAKVSLVPGEKFKIDAQEGALNFYQFGKKQAKHYFCKNCGIHTFSETSRRPGQYIVNLGCVDGVDTFALETTVFDGKHLL
ncbi:MAG TPA: GFA family protein [Gallionella sp.]|nr:GFA family protein [Gallionella sp.]